MPANGRRDLIRRLKFNVDTHKTQTHTHTHTHTRNTYSLI